MVDFINEVEEELRKDKYNVLLRKFGPYIVGLLIAVVSVAAFIEFQKYTSSKQARAASASYVAAGKLAKDGDLQASIEEFVALASVSPEGYAGLSYSRAAGIKVQLGDLQGAVDFLDKSAEAFTNPVHKDLAGLKASYILMELGRYDDVRARLASLATDGAPYQDLAKELQAYAELKTGDLKAARAQFSYLANVPGVLGGVKGRAKQIVTLLNASLPVPDLTLPVEDLPTPNPEIEKLKTQPKAQEE